MKKLKLFLASLLCFAPQLVNAQNRSNFIGLRNAVDYAYGVVPNIPPLSVSTGFIGSGSQTVIVSQGTISLPDGTQITPLSTTAPITIGLGANAETVTPSAVSCSTPLQYNTCSFTATFTNSHGVGDPVASASYGLVEAVNVAHGLGGLVGIDGRWVSFGGTTSTITSNKGWTNVTVLDWRGTSGAVSYKSTSNGANMAATTNVLY
jgi:hypothetical protein